MAMQPSEEKGKSNHAEPIAEIEDAGVSVGSYYRPLWQAAIRGDWESAKRFFERDAASQTAKITSRLETVLHVAALYAQDQFLENLVELSSPHPEALEMVDCDGRTALHNAVLCGRIRMVMALVRSNPKLTQFADDEGCVPLAISAQEASKHKNIAWFLVKNTTDDGPSHPFSSASTIRTVVDLTWAGHHDLTLYIVGRYPHLLTTRGGYFHSQCILQPLVAMGSHFLSGTKFSVMEALVYKCISVDLNYESIDESSNNPVPTIKRIYEVKLRHVAAVELAKQVCKAISHMTMDEITKFLEKEEMLFRAISQGIPELVQLFIQCFPELIGQKADGKTFRTIAVEYRQESILGLFLKGSPTNALSFIPAPSLDESMEIMLAAAYDYPNLGGVNKVSGAAFKTQKELQWFKAIEMCMIPGVRTTYFGGKTCWELFVKSHQKLLEDGEKWVKETANSRMLVSTLIATIFNTRIPLLLGKDSLLVFATSDTLGLFSSVTAIMLFLSILTSPYEYEDFLHSLPKKIIVGLSFLFLSLAFMLVAFAATLTIVLDKRLEWVFIPITLMVSLTVVLFLGLLLSLLFRMVQSTYRPGILRPASI
ncbi:hypothetical protein BT93_C2031 [Corymbia citriodora subsp. variegata]|nr:hypothetical protein BT93_C2031 [Corymbia citriodora subsp. variegata]